MGWLQTAGRLGSAGAPWVAKWLKVYHEVLPFGVMGTACFISAALLLYIEETKDMPTIEELDDEGKTEVASEKSKLLTYIESSTEKPRSYQTCSF